MAALPTHLFTTSVCHTVYLRCSLKLWTCSRHHQLTWSTPNFISFKYIFSNFFFQIHVLHFFCLLCLTHSICLYMYLQYCVYLEKKKGGRGITCGHHVSELRCKKKNKKKRKAWRRGYCTPLALALRPLQVVVWLLDILVCVISRLRDGRVHGLHHSCHYGT